MLKMKKFDVDVVIAGGGVAGVSAALSAARGGFRTMLLESQISLGGLATNGYVNGVAGMVEGICQEWLDRMEGEGYLNRRPHQSSIDPERGKFTLESMLLEAGVRILYGATVTDTIVREDPQTGKKTITGVVCHTRSGRLEVSARIVIDGTGDAEVAASAGVPFEVGSPEFGGLNMSTTLAFRMSRVNMMKYGESTRTYQQKRAAEGRPTGMGMLAELQDEAIKNGDIPSFIFPTALIYPVPPMPPEDTDICVMTTHSFYTRNDDTEDVTRQVIEQHRQIQHMETFMRKYLPGFGNARVSGMASLHGIRDSRRIIGEYVLKDRDVACAQKFEDGIAKFPEFFDTHHPTSRRLGFIRHIHLDEPQEPAVCRPAQCDGEMHPFYQPGGYEARVNPLDYCDIPYRSLVPLEIDNLFVVGRCVSAEFHAIAAVRVIALCMSTGQAAGVAAVLCLKHGVTPRQLDGKMVRKTMIEMGIPLDKAPGGHWAEVREQLKDGEFIVLPGGDFVAVMTKDGLRTHM